MANEAARLGPFRTFAAWMAALAYLAAGAYSLKASGNWWGQSLAELAVLVGVGGVFLLPLIGPLTKHAFPTLTGLGRATRGLAFAGAALGAAVVPLGVAVLVSGRFFAYYLEGATSVDAPFAEPLYWTFTVGLLVPWLIHVNLVAWKSKAWNVVTASAGVAAGVAALLVPVTFLDLPFGATELAVLVSIIGGLALPLWLLLVAARLGSPAGGARAAAFGLAPVVVVVVGVNLWASARLRAYQEEWRGDLQAERARAAALTMPVPNGEPMTCNAVDRYLPLLETLTHSGYPDSSASDQRDPLIEDSRLVGALGNAASGDAFSPLPDEVAETLASRRALVDSLGEATRCEKVDWHFPYERGFAAPIPSLLAARTLANLATLDGHERARAGDLERAAERYLEVMRFGADFETQGVLIMNLIGVAIRGIGQDALGALVTTGAPPRLPLETISPALQRFDTVPSSVAAGFRGERLTLVPGLIDGLGTPLASRIAGRAFVANALGEILPLLRSAEQAAGEADLPRATARLAPAFQAAATSGNPVVAILVPSLGRASLSAAQARARAALLSAAVAAEEARQRDGRYPADLPDLPADPFALPKTLRYRVEADGAGYAVWSVGENGTDDDGSGSWGQGRLAAGNQDDIVLRREPARD